jgi:plasmid stabilization system protein ParE
MNYGIIIEPTARQGIREAVRWKTENTSRTLAGRWYNGLLKKVDTLKTHPGRCPLAAETAKFPEDIRELIYGKRRNAYRIVFAIRADTVHILFVHHCAKDELKP